MVYCCVSYYYYYHLTQATWRKVAGEGLTDRYHAEEEVRLFCGKLDGLALLPPEDIAMGLASLEKDAPEYLRAVLTYFDETYVRDLE